MTRPVSSRKAQLVSSFEKALSESELTGAQASCIAEQLRSSSRQELENLILSGDDEAFVKLAEPCTG